MDKNGITLTADETLALAKHIVNSSIHPIIVPPLPLLEVIVKAFNDSQRAQVKVLGMYHSKPEAFTPALLNFIVRNSKYTTLLNAVLADDRLTCESVTRGLDESVDDSVRLSALRKKNLSLVAAEKFLSELSTSSDRQTRIAVARDTRTPIPVLTELAKDESVAVASVVAVHPNLTIEMIATLVRRDDLKIFLALLSRNDLAPEVAKTILRILSSHPKADVRARVAEDPRTGSDILVHLMDDASLKVLRRVAVARQLPTENRVGLLKSDRWEVRKTLAAHPNLPADAAEVLAQDQRPSVLVALLENPKTPLPLVMKLTSHTNTTVGVKARKVLRARTL